MVLLVEYRVFLLELAFSKICSILVFLDLNIFHIIIYINPGKTTPENQAKLNFAGNNFAGRYFKYLPAKYPMVGRVEALDLRRWGTLPEDI